MGRQLGGRWPRWILLNALLLEGALLLIVALGALVNAGDAAAFHGENAFGELLGALLLINAFTYPVLPLSLVALAWLDRLRHRTLARFGAILSGPLTLGAVFLLAAGDASALQIAFFLGVPSLLLGWLSRFPSDVEAPGPRG